MQGKIIGKWAKDKLQCILLQCEKTSNHSEKHAVPKTRVRFEMDHFSVPTNNLSVRL